MSSHGRSQTHISHISLLFPPPFLNSLHTASRCATGPLHADDRTPPPLRRSALRIEDDLMSTRLFELLDSDGSNESAWIHAFETRI